MTSWRFLGKDDLPRLFASLQDRGYTTVGPQVRDGAIVYDTLTSPEALPWGTSETQAPGRYRVGRGPKERCFAWANGPQALKPLLFAPRERLWRAELQDGRPRFHRAMPETGPTAVVGVRPCDIAALAIHDQHFLGGVARDPQYEARRRELLIVAVNCTHPSDTCFCASTGDGPQAREGFDLLLHELDDGFLVHAGSDRGEAVAADLPLEAGGAEREAQVGRDAVQAVRRQKRGLPSRNLRDYLFERLEHPRWEDVAGRCLSCANCTQVCPTCFCYHETDEPVLDGSESEHWREWDSCFTEGHSYIHGIVIRPDTRQRYRQWLTHKLGGWHDQFGRSGCVGCGRCITWCPVGIDITEEVAALCGDACGF